MKKRFDRQRGVRNPTPGHPHHIPLAAAEAPVLKQGRSTFCLLPNRFGEFHLNAMNPERKGPSAARHLRVAYGHLTGRGKAHHLRLQQSFNGELLPTGKKYGQLKIRRRLFAQVRKLQLRPGRIGLVRRGGDIRARTENEKDRAQEEGRAGAQPPLAGQPLIARREGGREALKPLEPAGMKALLVRGSAVGRPVRPAVTQPLLPDHRVRI